MWVSTYICVNYIATHACFDKFALVSLRSLNTALGMHRRPIEGKFNIVLNNYIDKCDLCIFSPLTGPSSYPI